MKYAGDILNTLLMTSLGACILVLFLPVVTDVTAALFPQFWERNGLRVVEFEMSSFVGLLAVAVVILVHKSSTDQHTQKRLNNYIFFSVFYGAEEMAHTHEKLCKLICEGGDWETLTVVQKRERLDCLTEISEASRYTLKTIDRVRTEIFFLPINTARRLHVTLLGGDRFKDASDPEVIESQLMFDRYFALMEEHLLDYLDVAASMKLSDLYHAWDMKKYVSAAIEKFANARQTLRDQQQVREFADNEWTKRFDQRSEYLQRVRARFERAN